jgi:hypothetical protein
MFWYAAIASALALTLSTAGDFVVLIGALSTPAGATDAYPPLQAASIKIVSSAAPMVIFLFLIMFHLSLIECRQFDSHTMEYNRTT